MLKAQPVFDSPLCGVQPLAQAVSKDSETMYGFEVSYPAGRIIMWAVQISGYLSPEIL